MSNFQKLIKECDRLYSIYRRLDEAKDGYNSCCTCGSLYYWKEIDLGHYISRSILSTRWIAENTAPQCVRCNRFEGGKRAEFYKYLCKKYSEEKMFSIKFASGLSQGCVGQSYIQSVIEMCKERIPELKNRL